MENNKAVKIGGMIKMTFKEMLEKRESCRAFSSRPVTRDDLMKLVEAGRLSPSGCNAQPWRFIVVDEPGAKEKLCDALVVDGGATGAPFRKQVPAFIIIVEQPAKVMPFVKDHYGDTQRFAQGDIGKDGGLFRDPSRQRSPPGSCSRIQCRGKGSTEKDPEVHRRDMQF